MPIVSDILNITDAGCEGQSNGGASISISGGTASFETNFQNIGNFSGNVINLQGLSAGNYNFTITDQNNCMTSDSFQITSFPALSASMETIYNVCDDDCFINASATVSGGSPPYSFFWYDGQSHQNPVLNCFPDHVLTVTDQNGCTAIVNVVINPPQPLRIDTIMSFQPQCNGDTGVVEVHVSGGVGNINFVWSDGTTGSSRSDLSVGQYIVFASDAKMCTVSDTITISEPEPLYVNVIINDATEQGVSDGSILLIVSGGVAPYNVLWNTGQTGNALDSIPAGIYFFTITDANNCESIGSAIVSNAFCFLSAEAQTIDPSCFGNTNGRIIITPDSDEHQPSVRLFNSSSQELTEFDSLGAGIYTVLITDTLGCQAIINDIMIINPQQITADSIIAILPTSDMHSDGILSADISGGTGTLSYQWYLNDWPYSNESHIEDLPNGIYDLVVTDSAGCQAMFGPFNFLLVGNDEYVIMNENILMYPNPATDFLFIEWNGSVVKPEIMIISPNGKHIHISEKVEAATNQIRIDTAHLLPGLYTVIFYNGKFRSYKVIKL